MQQEYQLAAVTHGIKAAPFLTIMTINKLANDGDNQAKVTLVATESRIEQSSKIISLPHLEVCGDHLLVKLMTKVMEFLARLFNNIKIDSWCDSTAVLGWLHGYPGQWKTFLSNISRQDDNRSTYVTEDESKKQSNQKQVSIIKKQTESIISNLLSKHSFISKITRILAWVYRFISKSKQKGFLSSEELSKAKQAITKHEHEKQFEEDLPQARSNPLQPFTKTGVDFTGNISVTAIKKRRIRSTQENISLNDVVIIHGANLPPGKWLMGRVIELHPGSDSYVRVVTLKTKNGVLKRPVTKVSILPVHEQAEQQTTSDTNQSSSPTLSNPRIKLSTLFASIILFLSIITSTQCLNATNFRDNQHLYFDKISNMNIIRDEWKLVIYYKMQPYWEGITAINKSIIILDRACETMKRYNTCNIIQSQLRHELNELDYNNQLLLNQQDGTRAGRERRRRGLIDGVGYLANYLFGVLDSRFAEQYGKDITLLRDNQKHISSLWRKQTSIIEVEFNIIKRVESVMSQQHKIIHQKLYEIQNTVALLKSDLQISSDFTMGALFTSNLVQNLKHLQRILIDTITDIYHGRFNPYLIDPKQLQNQLSIISSHLTSDVKLPIENIHAGISKIFKLITTKARMITDYLIFELRIPLISRDSFEIFKIIPIPEAKRDSMINIKPISDYVAINLKKDTYLSLSENSIRSCLVADTYLCHISKPTYRIGGDKDFCQKKEQACETIISPCKNIWLESNALNNYIYFCCNQCLLRVMCGDQVTTHQLIRSGIVTIKNGCIIKTDDFEITAHQLPSSELSIQSDIYSPVIAPINHIINVSIPHEVLKTFETEQDKELGDIEKELKIMKNESFESNISYHDIHHYTVLYIIILLTIMGGAIWCWSRARGTWTLRVVPPAPAAAQPLSRRALSPRDAPRLQYQIKVKVLVRVLVWVRPQ